jgi:hypothetical protein
MALMDYASEADAYKRLLQTPEIGVTEAHQNAPAPAPASLAASQAQAVQQDSLLEMPQSPLEQVVEKNGKAKTLGKMALTALSGGLLAPVLMPELMGAGKKYEAEMEAYKKEKTSANLAERVSQIDFDNIQPEDIPYLELASGDFGKLGTEMYDAQNTQKGADHDVADHAGVGYRQWMQRGDPQKQADRARYAASTGNLDSYINPVLAQEGKTPEQVGAVKQAESEGTGRGNEITSDRQMVTGIRRQVKNIDRGMSAVSDVRSLIESRQADPGKFAAGMRSIFGVETYEDGRMSATAAQSVIDQLKEVTLGAISKSELELLLGGLLDPTRSPESNLGSLDTALERMEASKELAVDDAKLAWGRLAGDEGQADYLGQQAEDDWYYMNMGDGSKLKPITRMVDGEEKSVTFSDYYNKRRENAGPYEELSREQIVVDYRKAREAEKDMWEKQQKVKAELQEEARRALELEFME